MNEQAPQGRADHAAGLRQFLTFVAGRERMAVDLAVVRDILEAVAPQPVPRLPPALCGVMDVQGVCVPVVDLAAHFGARPRPASPQSILLLEGPQPVGRSPFLGLAVDAVGEVVALDATRIQASPALTGSGAPTYWSGLADLGSRYVAILNVAALLTREEISVLEQVMAAL